jgi:aryl-alcohol dehydrogenase-like predicted oxidoreductase
MRYLTGVHLDCEHRRFSMSPSDRLGGTFTPAGTSLALHRMGYGAIQLTGPMAFGPPRDRQAALAVVREAVRLGINHIDTSDFYGPHIANEIIREAIHPYPKDLAIVTKAGVRRGPDKSWPAALSREELTGAVQDNLRHLGLDVLEIVNLRAGDPFGRNESSIAEPLTVLADLQAKGLIRHIGLSNISQRQFAEAQAIAKIVCVQNHYNLAHRQDDSFIDMLAEQGIAYVPFFPLGGFRPIQSPLLDAAAASLGATPRQVALAWLLQRSPNILIIAGTSSAEHLRDNLKAASLVLPPDIVAQLDRIAGNRDGT